MLVFRCRDVGNNDCVFEAREATEEELVAKIRTHYREHYGTDLMPATLLERVLRAIRFESDPTGAQPPGS